MIKEIEARLKQYRQVRKDREAKSSVRAKTEEEISSECRKIQAFLTKASPFMQAWGKLFDRFCTMKPNGAILFDGRAETGTFSHEDYRQVAEQCMKCIASVCRNPQNEPAQIRECCLSYNTLLLILRVREKLIENAVSERERAIGRRIEDALAELDADDDPDWQAAYALLEQGDGGQALALLKEEIACTYCEGNVVYGTKEGLILPEGRVDLPVFLQAKERDGAVFLKTEKEEQACAILKGLLPGMFEQLAVAYRPSSFSLAFLEKANVVESVCGRFCNRIADSKLDSCGVVSGILVFIIGFDEDSMLHSSRIWMIAIMLVCSVIGSSNFTIKSIYSDPDTGALYYEYKDGYQLKKLNDADAVDRDVDRRNRTVFCQFQCQRVFE